MVSLQYFYCLLPILVELVADIVEVKLVVVELLIEILTRVRDKFIHVGLDFLVEILELDVALLFLLLVVPLFVRELLDKLLDGLKLVPVECPVKFDGLGLRVDVLFFISEQEFIFEPEALVLVLLEVLEGPDKLVVLKLLPRLSEVRVGPRAQLVLTLDALDRVDLYVVVEPVFRRAPLLGRLRHSPFAGLRFRELRNEEDIFLGLELFDQVQGGGIHIVVLQILLDPLDGPREGEIRLAHGRGSGSILLRHPRIEGLLLIFGDGF